MINRLLLHIKKDDIFGITGSISLLSAYYLTTNKYNINDKYIDILNIYGSFSLGYNCFKKKAYPPFILETVWFSIALKSLISKKKNEINILE